MALVAGAVGVVAGADAPVSAASGDFTVSPTSLSFPDTYVGSTSSMAVTITNGSATTQTPNFAGGAPNDPSNFGGSQNCAGVALDPGATCQFTYTFEPSSPGDHTSATTIGIDGDNFSISMSGHGVFPFTVAPTDVAFPDTAVGDTSSVPVVITNISSTSLTPNYAGGAPNDPTNFGGLAELRRRGAVRRTVMPVHVHVHADGARPVDELDDDRRRQRELRHLAARHRHRLVDHHHDQLDQHHHVDDLTDDGDDDRDVRVDVEHARRIVGVDAG